MQGCQDPVEYGVSTHSRAEAAAFSSLFFHFLYVVSTHSRAEAAAFTPNRN